MRKITKNYLLVVAFVFLLLPILKVSADTTLPDTGSSTPDQVATTTVILTYTTDGNGSIEGTATQTITQGSDGTTVTAVANPGFIFSNWSDNSTSTTRTDTNILSDIVVTANFVSSTTNPDQNSTSTTTNPIVSTSTATSTVNVFVRYNDQVLFNGQIELPTDPDAQFSVTDDSSTTRQISAQSALAVLENAVVQNNNFNISDLQYYPSPYSEFIINCINITAGTSTNTCYNWQYLINGKSPQGDKAGIDQQILKNNDSLVLYFGNPLIINLSTNTVAVNTPITATTEKYNYTDNTYLPVSNVILGTSSSTSIFTTSTTDNQGQTTFSFNTPGRYNIGIYNNDYGYEYLYPENAVEITEATTTATSTDSGSTSSGGSSTIHKTPNLEAMLSFLDSHQNADGSFGSDLYTDWAAVAYGSTSGHASAKNKLINFLKIDSLDDTLITSYERRSMAMMSLGLNPYKDGTQNYIQKIVDIWNTEPLGYISPTSDDIFGIITLVSAGYNANDQIIQKLESSVISKQSSNGEWDSVDLTGAAIQALSLVQSLPGANSAISKGLNFLKTTQVADGGFYNPDSTSWAIQGLIAGNFDPKQLVNNGNDPLDYLSSNQLADGSIGTTTDTLDTRVWATEWAIPATALETWPQILKSVSKPVESSGGGLSSTDASTTPVLATTTSTTTLPLAIQISTSTASTTSIKIVPTYTALTNKTLITPNEELGTTTSTSTQNTNQLAGAAGSGFNFDTHKVLMILGSILAGIGVFSIIFI